jgi:SsrA-binding protein
MKLIASNPQAKADYHWEEVVEAGIVLTGTEVKSLRSQSPTLKEAFVEIRSSKAGTLEAWLLHLHIPPYKNGNIWNHDPLRIRKLLLHHHQITKIFGAIRQKGLSAFPTQLYFKDGMVKVEVALGKGKSKGDKRDTVKKRQAEREMARAKRS